MSTPSPIRLTPGKGLLALIGINVGVAAYVALCELLGFTAVWTGFLFGLYWGAFEHMKPERLFASIGGAVMGLLLGFLLKFMPLWMGPIGLAIAVVATFFVLYCQLVQWLPLVANLSTITFLLVVTIPEIQKYGDFTHMFACLALGIVVLAGLLAILTRVKKRGANAAPV